MVQKIVIIGGSHAFWEINELINDINDKKKKYEIVGILDDNIELIGKNYNGITVCGPLEKANEFSADIKFIFAIGSYKTRVIRSEILKRLNITEVRYETLIHPTAKIFSSAKIGYGCIIHYGSVVFNHSYIDSFCIISANCVIAVANNIGKGALLGSNVTTTTGVKIGSFSFIGSSCTIGENIEIGPCAQVGLGSVILNNVKPGIFILGTPPKVLNIIDVPVEIIKDWEVNKIKSLLN
jgi:sugar O-acyltransferase (sialic acid O-acetyltransferase NeuD family)